MASLSHSGLFVASIGQGENMDDYEDDDADNLENADKSKSNLFYKPFNDEHQEWKYAL